MEKALRIAESDGRNAAQNAVQRGGSWLHEFSSCSLLGAGQLRVLSTLSRRLAEMALLEILLQAVATSESGTPQPPSIESIPIDSPSEDGDDLPQLFTPRSRSSGSERHSDHDNTLEELASPIASAQEESEHNSNPGSFSEHGSDDAMEYPAHFSSPASPFFPSTPFFPSSPATPTRGLDSDSDRRALHWLLHRSQPERHLGVLNREPLMSSAHHLGEHLTDPFGQGSHRHAMLPHAKVADEYSSWGPLKCALSTLPALLSKHSAAAHKAIAAATHLLNHSCVRISGEYDFSSTRKDLCVEVDKFPIVLAALGMLKQMADPGDEQVVAAILQLLEMHDPAHWCVVRVVILEGKYKHTLNYEGVRRAAVQALAVLATPGDAKVIDNLKAIVKDECQSYEVQSLALRSLLALTPPAWALLSELLQCGGQVRSDVIASLAALNASNESNDAAEVTKFLGSEICSRSRPGSARRALEVLQRFVVKGHAAIAVKALVERLGCKWSSSDEMVDSLLQTLGMIASTGRDAAVLVKSLG
ncbi:unnamed protein product [Effrenium voratum]|nr:unnamed protein product [Effrenium voratum]